MKYQTHAPLILKGEMCKLCVVHKLCYPAYQYYRSHGSPACQTGFTVAILGNLALNMYAVTLCVHI